MACNPKEYFELFENNKLNKKHKEIKKDSSGMNFENYVSRLVSLTNFDKSLKNLLNIKFPT